MPGVDVEDAWGDNEQDQHDLDCDDHQFEAPDGPGSGEEEPSLQDADDEGGDIDDAAPAFIGGGGRPIRHVDADPGEEDGESAGDADVHDRHDGDLLQQAGRSR